MTKRVMRSLVVLSIAALGACDTSEPATETETVERVAEPNAQAAIDSVLNELVAAWNRDDLTGHVDAYSDSATYTTPAGLDVGHAAIEQNMQYFVMPDSGLAGTLAFDDVLVRMLGAEHALATGSFLVEDVRDTTDIRGRFTLVLERDSTGWRVLHDHSS